MATAVMPEVEQLEPEKKEALELVSNAKGLTVTDNQSYVEGAAMLKAVVERLRSWKDAIAPAKEAAHQAHKKICDLEKTVAEPLMTVETYLRKQITGYTTEQERIRRVEEDRLRKEAEERARKEAEDAQVAAALEAEKAGDTLGAEQIVAAPPELIYVPPVVLEKSVPKVAGISSRKAWKFRVVDAAKVPREFLIVDEAKLRKFATAMQDQAKVPGVEFYAEDSTIVR